ncbi:uncharacterized protein LOC117574895 [Drosophila albomicans]|uniref:Uncharacterized protein LOC117574895 n=2 Tax=nasuta subgroup TaxID=32307 RepID=A0A6P8XNZ6_DROAB|nr:uncharacterized protein LOC117574895 [Drosophila albomicans]XP_051862493.1 uncharacterized protein LOC117574895 [Drosophila albomicans]XP_051862494.1 uncharacterized protein LOC117574895 [Drosophila albomicans]
MDPKKLTYQVLFVLISCSSSSSLLYPASSDLGLTYSVSVPVAEYYPERRILIDWCFAVSYSLPYNLTSFYSIPIWPGFANYKTKRDVLQTDETDVSFYTKYGYNTNAATHPKDFSAGQLYAAIEDSLSSYGFHDTCLLRSVCELSKHPFDEHNQHMLSDIMNFLLSPSQHEGFLESEHVYKQAYEQAELDGFLGKNCAQLYSHCKHDVLRLITNVILPNS